MPPVTQVRIDSSFIRISLDYFSRINLVTYKTLIAVNRLTPTCEKPIIEILFEYSQSAVRLRIGRRSTGEVVRTHPKTVGWNSILRMQPRIGQSPVAGQINRATSARISPVGMQILRVGQRPQTTEEVTMSFDTLSASKNLQRAGMEEA